MKSEDEVRECAFVSGRACAVESDEVPLDVCRLCLEAWRTNSQNITVRPSVKRLKPAVETSEAPRTVQAKPSTFRVEEPHAPVQSQLSLSELDKLFWEGKIEMGQDLQRRKEIVNSLSREGSPFSSLEEALGRLEAKGPIAESAVFVVEGGRVRAKHPEGILLPEGLDGEPLKALQELYACLNERNVDAHLEVGWKRIACLGCRGKRIALLVLDSKVKLEDFAEGIREAQTMLREHDNWEEILPLLHSVAVGWAKPAVAKS